MSFAIVFYKKRNFLDNKLNYNAYFDKILIIFYKNIEFYFSILQFVQTHTHT